jgi:hypothetical protein
MNAAPLTHTNGAHAASIAGSARNAAETSTVNAALTLLLVPCGDHRRMAEAILQLLRDKQASWRRSASS